MINARGILQGKPGGPYDVIVKDGDKLIIPKKTQDVTILGEVQSPTSHVYEPGLTRDDYIAEERRHDAARRSQAHLRRARQRRCRLGRAAPGGSGAPIDMEIRPGDTIVVPLDTQKVPTAAAGAGDHHHHL